MKCVSNGKKKCTSESCPLSGQKICSYKECQLPDNNKKFIVQLIYLGLSIFVLNKSAHEFTFYSVIMFTAPILLDLWSSQFNGRLYEFIRILFLILNGFVAMLCAAGMFGLLADCGDTFVVVPSAIVGAEYVIYKRHLIYLMLADLLIPIIMAVACPTKAMKEVSDFIAETRKDGKK